MVLLKNFDNAPKMTSPFTAANEKNVGIKYESCTNENGKIVLQFVENSNGELVSFLVTWGG